MTPPPVTLGALRPKLLEYLAAAVAHFQALGTYYVQGRPVAADALQVRCGRGSRFEMPRVAVPTVPRFDLDALCRALHSLIVPVFDGHADAVSYSPPESVAMSRVDIPPARAGEGRYRFVFHCARERAPADLAQLAGYATEAMLDLVTLYCEGEPILPTEFRMGPASVRIDRGAIPSSQYLGDRVESRWAGATLHPLQTVAATEPAIVVLARHACLVGALLEEMTRSHGWTRRPEAASPMAGIALRDLEDWKIPSSGNPSEIYEYLARVCNVSCEFCYLYGNPPKLAVGRGAKVISEQELETRFEYFDPDSKTTLFQAQWELNEFLVDPKLASTLRRLRKQLPTEAFHFITNGNPLTPEVIDLLAELKPVEVVVSANTLSASLRSRLMHEVGKRTRTAYDALDGLRRAGIPFAVSVVALPSVPYEDLKHTIQVAAEKGAALIRVNLPGYTREHPNRLNEDLDAFWKVAVGFVKALRKETDVPVVCIPSAYEESLADGEAACTILGVIPNSPAQRAGLRSGDELVRVGSTQVRTRAQLVSVLLLRRAPFEITVRREGTDQIVRIEQHALQEYPYSGHVFAKYLVPHGIVIAPSLSSVDAGAIEAIARKYSPGEAWMLTSEIMLPAAQRLIAEYCPATRERVKLKVVKPNFLGGNIKVLDMCTVSDIVASLAPELAAQPRPRVIILPDTGLNSVGRDLEGRHWDDIQRELEVPTELVSVTARFAF